MEMSTTTPTIGLTRCPGCGGPIVYEKQRTGLAWLHELDNGDLEFLCPDPVDTRSER